MIIDITVPGLGESISEVEIGPWHKQVGDPVVTDEPIVDIESEKAAVEVPAPSAGVLVEILKQTGEAAGIGEVVGRIDTEKQASVPAGSEAPSAAADAPPPIGEEAPTIVEKTPPADVEEDTPPAPATPIRKPATDKKVMPAAARLMAEKGIDTAAVTGTGPGGRILKEDVQRAQNAPRTKPESASPKPAVTPAGAASSAAASGIGATGSAPPAGTRTETRTRMSKLRRTIARRLLEAKQSMAMLTTFNEVDMSAVKTLRKELGQAFVDKHGVKLGFMSFFVKATVAALRDYPNLNARIEGEDVVESHFCDIGVAIGGGKGLVVPVLRNAEQMPFAEVERQIASFGEKAKHNSLTLDDLEGGTFTISNGGVFGSMMSTPIINPPQSGILGLHAIKDRPVAVDGQVVIRPIMYLALSYDHRIVDGREAVSFLKGIKDRIENPSTLLLEL